MIENGANNEKENLTCLEEKDILVSPDPKEMQKDSDFVNAKIEDIGYGYYQFLYFFIFLYQQINEGIASCFLGFTLIPLKKFYHATNNDIEIASSTIFLSFGLGCFIIGFIKKILSRKEIIFYSIFLITLSSTLILFFTSIEMYIILRMITNFCLRFNNYYFWKYYLRIYSNEYETYFYFIFTFWFSIRNASIGYANVNIYSRF